ncbi:MAG: hypothetical protein HY023_06470, partial [Chloroflexi bacterium]|nr:hypothetical protein [Chloroflexota bacterium]
MMKPIRTSCGRLSSPPLQKDRKPAPTAERGQALILMTISFLALLAFVGLVTDVGMLYLTYGQLKRAVDAAAVAASNDFKRGESLSRLTDASQEMMNFHNVDPADLNLSVFICD